MARTTFASVDDYLAQIESGEARAALEHLRRLILSTLPEAEECISYGIPTYKVHGMVASFAAFKNHCSFFPGHTVADFADRLVGYKMSKGTIQFTPEKPIPDETIVAIVKARAAENSAAAAEKKSKRA